MEVSDKFSRLPLPALEVSSSMKLGLRFGRRISAGGEVGDVTGTRGICLEARAALTGSGRKEREEQLILHGLYCYNITAT